MYDQEFYEVIRSGAEASARAVAPLVLGLLDEPGDRRPKHVVDVGCGEGWWARAFADLGCTVAAIDGEWWSEAVHPLGDRFTAVNLEQSFTLADTFDLAVCLEVAEHLRPERAASLVADLCALAPVVLFSAAIPGQGGTGHVNEQWPSYWSALFTDQGYEVSGALRFELWEDDRVENWYRQNTLVAVADAHPRTPALARLFTGPGVEPLPLVHPVLFDHVRATK